MIPEKGYLRPNEKGYSRKDSQERETKSDYLEGSKDLKITSEGKASLALRECMSSLLMKQTLDWVKIP